MVNEQRLNLAGQSLRINRLELRHLLEVLQERALGAVELEFSNPAFHGRPVAETEQLRNELNDGYLFFVTVAGFNGDQINGTIEEVFDSPNFPKDVASLFVDSSTKLRGKNYQPRNSLVLFIDFRRPAIFDFNLMPSHATENNSYFSARGLDPTWVRGVYHELESFVREHRVGARWLHRHSVYDVLLFLVGFPVAFWVSFRLSAIIGTAGSSEFLRAGLYLYAGISALWIFRALFHYARWLWPLVEFKRDDSTLALHRAAWGVVSSILLYPFIYDVTKKLLGW